MRHTKRSAFTLLEMMVVIAIIALMALMSVPLFNALVAEANEDLAVSRLNNALAVARSLALTNQQIHTVEFATVEFMGTGRNVLAVYVDRHPPAPQSFSTWTELQDPDSGIAAGPFLLENIDPASAFNITGAIQAGGDWDTGDHSLGPNIAFGPEGYVLDPDGQRKVRLRVEGGADVIVEVLRIGTTRVYRQP